MFRWLPLVLYFPLVPLVACGLIPEPLTARLVGVPALLAGLLVVRFHLQQSRTKGYLGVLLGYAVGIGLGGCFEAFGLLSLAFLSASGKYAQEIKLAAYTLTVLTAFFSPLFGAWLGAQVARGTSPGNVGAG